MSATILNETAGSVLFEEGGNFVFADRGTSYRRVVLFVLLLLTVIFGVNGLIWLAIGARGGEVPIFGAVLLGVAFLGGMAISSVWKAERRDAARIPEPDQSVAILDFTGQFLAKPNGERLAALSDVRFVPTIQFGSSARALTARWSGGSLVVFRGHPFAGTIRPVQELLRRRGLDVD